MKKQKRLANAGKRQPPLVTGETALPVTLFQNSLRLWQARWQARKSADQAGTADQQAGPKGEE